MKRLIKFFKKLFGRKQVCPKCKQDPCKCEMKVPVEHKVELKEPEVIHAFDVKDATYVSEFTTMPTNVADHNLKGDGDTCYSESIDTCSKWECTSTATIGAVGLNQNECCKVESVPTKKKRVRKKKVVPVVVDQGIPAEEPEVPVVEISTPVEVPAEKTAEPKKKRSRKKKVDTEKK